MQIARRIDLTQFSVPLAYRTRKLTASQIRRTQSAIQILVKIEALPKGHARRSLTFRQLKLPRKHDEPFGRMSPMP
jgi:hypothetical protein